MDIPHGIPWEKYDLMWDPMGLWDECHPMDVLWKPLGLWDESSSHGYPVESHGTDVIPCGTPLEVPSQVPENVTDLRPREKARMGQVTDPSFII